MKMWRVDVSFSVMVVADDAENAMEVASEHAREELGNQITENVIAWPELVTDQSYVDERWLDTCPYGGGGEQKVRELVPKVVGCACRDSTDGRRSECGQPVVEGQRQCRYCLDGHPGRNIH